MTACRTCYFWKRRNAVSGTCWRWGWWSRVLEHDCCPEWIAKVLRVNE